MKKDGYSENTIEPVGRRLGNLAKNANLANPDEIKGFIARADWSNGYKDNLVNAYNHYTVSLLSFFGLKRSLCCFGMLRCNLFQLCFQVCGKLSALCVHLFEK